MSHEERGITQQKERVMRDMKTYTKMWVQEIDGDRDGAQHVRIAQQKGREFHWFEVWLLIFLILLLMFVYLRMYMAIKLMKTFACI
jgi:hypothetical protein